MGKITKEQLEAIDLKEVEQEVSRLIGVNVDLKKEVNETNDSIRWSNRDTEFVKEYRIAISTENLIHLTGIMAAVFTAIVINAFGGNAYTDKETGEQWYCLPLHLAWEHKGGGSNSTSLVDCFYNFTSATWTFKEGR